MRQLILTVFILLSLFLQISSAQDWKTNDQNLNPDELRFYTTNSFVCDIDFDKLFNQLTKLESRNKQTKLNLPLPDGSYRMFDVIYDPIYEPGLGEKFPNIKTFQIKSGAYHGRADINLNGFHAMLYTPEGTVLIDPALEGSTDQYMVYYAKDLIERETRSFSCEIEEANYLPMDTHSGDEESMIRKPKAMGMRSASPVVLRTYRTAVSCTGEYATFHGGTVEGAMAAIVTTINRVNTIYEVEHAVKLILIENNDQLIFLDPDTDPFTNSSLSAMLNENLNTINQIIGSSNYDIGHVFGTVGGGLAQLGSVCTNGKARGGTGLPNPRGDFFDIVYVGHEVGHQFAAAHTFNSCDDRGNESFGTGFEPGSGSTIMAYAGLCGPNNIKTATDYYFHNASLLQVRNFIESGAGSNCATEIATENTHPEVFINVPQNLTLPIGTPFELRGSAEDQEGDLVFLNWEQWDLGPKSNLGSPIGTAPLFVSQIPVSSGLRVLPSMQRVLSGTESNQEILPSSTRPVTFRLTGRDNHPGSGGASWKQLNMSATDQAGPFRVMTPAAQEQIQIGSFYEIEWDVANTDQLPVNCQFVDILISRNGGNSFADTLLSNIPNTGSALVVMPVTTGNVMRIKVAARDNIFFQVNRGNFRLIEPDTSTFTFIPEFPRGLVCTPSSVQIPVQTFGIKDFEGLISFDVNKEFLPDEVTYAFSDSEVPAGGETNLTINLENYNGFGELYFDIVGVSADLLDTLVFLVTLQIQNSLRDSPVAVNPAPGLESISAPIGFEWSEVPGANSYNFFLSSTPDFDGDIVFSAQNILDTFFTPNVFFDKSEVYFWRVEAQNDCGVIAEEVPFVFQTEVLSCTEYYKNENIFISASGTPTIFSEIEVPVEADIASVEVFNIDGSHQSFNDMDFWLFDPSDEGIRLLGRSCSTYGGSFNLSFSDLSAQGFSCPPNQVTTFRPAQPLNTFTGSQAEGVWTLRIRDVVAGSGGMFSGWGLNVCVNAAASRPELIINDTMFLRPGTDRLLGNTLLLVEDPIKAPSELIYTLTKAPRHGYVLFDQSTILEVGSQFSQADISSGRIQYKHEDLDAEEDQFFFIIRHDEGGFIGTQTFEIRTDEDFVSSVADIDRSLITALFPNPTDRQINIELNTQVLQPMVHIYNTTGQLVYKEQFTGLQNRLQFEVPQLVPGIYILTLITDNRISTKTFVKQ